MDLFVLSWHYRFVLVRDCVPFMQRQSHHEQVAMLLIPVLDFIAGIGLSSSIGPIFGIPFDKKNRKT
jgi:hypothetical protein